MVNAWQKHVKNVKSLNPGKSLKECLTLASKSYQKGGKSVKKTKKRVMKGGNLALSPGEFPGSVPEVNVDEGDRLHAHELFFKHHGKPGSDEQVDKMDMKKDCLLYTSPSPRDRQKSRMPSSA